MNKTIMNKHHSFAFTLLFTFLSCSSQSTEDSPQLVRMRKYNDSGSPPSLQAEQQRQVVRPRLVIKRASLSIIVNEYNAAFERVKAIINQHGGFIVSTNVNEQESRAKSGDVEIRVPSAQFDTTMSLIKSIADRAENESVRGNDITEEFYDLTARLSSKQKVEQRFLEILKSARSTKDILEIEKSLADVREEIETLQGRKRFLADQVDLSTISLKIREHRYDYSVDTESFVSKIVIGFRHGLSGIGDVLGFLITVAIAGLPIWILLFVLVYFSVVFYKRYKKPKLSNPPSQALPTENTGRKKRTS